MKLCVYGCDQEAKFQLKNGKTCCSIFYNSCPKSKETRGFSSRKHKKESKEKISKKMEGKVNLVAIQKAAEKNRGRKDNAEVRRRKSLAKEIAWKDLSSKYNSKECRGKQSELKKLHWKNENSYYNSKEYREFLRNFMLKRWSDKTSYLYSNNFRKLLSDEMKKKNKDPNFLKLIQRKPNKIESFLTNLFEKNFLGKYKFVGDSKVWIDGRNPDWIFEEKKKIIEYFGPYHHGEKFRKKFCNDSRTNKQHEEDRISHFKKEGYDTLILWETDLKDINNLVNKIFTFTGEKNGES